MRASFVIIMLMAWILAGVPVATQAAKADAAAIAGMMQKARGLLQGGDLKSALEEFEKVISVDAGNAEALYLAASIYLRMNQSAKGIRYLERSVAAAPDNVRLRLVLAQAYETAELYDKALDEYRRIRTMKTSATEKKEADKRERITLAKKLGHEGQLERALQEFSKVLKEYPEDVPTLLDEGLTLMFLDRLGEARAVMERAAGLEPQNGLIQQYLGDISQKEGRLEESARHYQKALQLLPPGSPQLGLIENKLASVRGALYLSEGKLAEARGEYEKLLAVEPKDIEARSSLARIYHELGDLSRSEEMLKSLLKDNPSDITTAVRLGALYIEQGKLEEGSRILGDVVAKGGDSPPVRQAQELLTGARQALEKNPGEALQSEERLAFYRAMVKANPGDRRSWVDLGRLYAQLGRDQEAEGALKEAVRLDAADASAQAALGGLYDDEGKFDLAIAPLSRALELEKDPALKEKVAMQVAVVMAKKAFNEGKLDVAQQEFSEIVELNPDDFVSHFFLGLIYTRNGSLDKAEAQYKDVLRIVPGHALARLNLATIREQTGHEEEAANDYKVVIISRLPGLADTARDRLDALNKRIGGVSLAAGYSLNFDSNSNLSPTTPTAELRSDTTGSISYQHKVQGRRLFWGLRFDPTYSIYHQQQFDFLSMAVSPFLNGVWHGLIWSANYSFNEIDGVLVEQHYNTSKSFYADLLKRFKMRSLVPFLIDDSAPVASAWRISGSYRTFRSTTSPIYDADSYSLGALLTQSSGDWSVTGIYNFTDNQNADTIGNDFAYTSHGVNLQVSRNVSPKLSLSGGYGFTYSQYAHPDSVTRFTKSRVNKFQSLFFGANYAVNDRLRFYGNFVYQLNNSNLPTGFILSTQDVGTAVGIQSPSLGDYRKYGLTTGLSINF